MQWPPAQKVSAATVQRIWNKTQTAAASGGVVPVQQRSAVCSQSLRHRRALYESAGQGDCAERGREEPDSGTGPDTADSTVTSRPSGTANTITNANCRNHDAVHAALNVLDRTVIPQNVDLPRHAASGLSVLDRESTGQSSRMPGCGFHLVSPQLRNTQTSQAKQAAAATRPRYLTCTSPQQVPPELNLIERWFAEITRKRIRRGTASEAFAT